MLMIVHGVVMVVHITMMIAHITVHRVMVMPMMTMVPGFRGCRYH